MARGKSKTTAAILLISALLAGLVMELSHQSILNEELRSTRSEVQSLSEQLTVLQADLRSQRVTPPPPPQDQGTELLRLREGIHELRRSLAELQQAQAATSNEITSIKIPEIPFLYPDSLPRREYSFRGYGTPQEALQTVLWALIHLDGKTFRASMAGRIADGYREITKDIPEDAIPGEFCQYLRRATGYHVVEEKGRPAPDDDTVVKIFLEGEGLNMKLSFKNIAGEWKWTWLGGS